jgi:hypothetical protein
VTPKGAQVQHPDVLDGRPDDVPLESSPDDLDLG